MNERISELQHARRILAIRIQELRGAGLGNEEIAAYLDISKSRVNLLIHSLIQVGEIQPLARGRRRLEIGDDFVSQVQELSSQGLSRRQMAEQMGLSYSHLCQRVNRLIEAKRIEPLPEKRGREHFGVHTRGSNYLTLSKLLTDFLVSHPNQPITLRQMREEVHLSIQRISQLYRNISEEQPVPPLRGLYIHREIDDWQVFEAQVEELAKQGLNRHEIAVSLSIHPGKVSAVMNHLREKLTDQVRLLRRQGLGDKAIAEMLGTTRGKVDRITSKLIREQEVPAMHIVRSSQQIAEFDNQVCQLRNEGLTRRQMAEILRASLPTINTSVQRLFKSGKIFRKIIRRSAGEVFTERELMRSQIPLLREQGLANQQIADLLGVKLIVVRSHVSLLIRQGLLQPLKGGHPRKPEK